MAEKPEETAAEAAEPVKPIYLAGEGMAGPGIQTNTGAMWGQTYWDFVPILRGEIVLTGMIFEVLVKVK